MGQQGPATGIWALAAAVLRGANWHSPLGGLEHRACRLQDSVTSGQTTNGEGAQPNPSADDWIKDLLNMALPTRARPSFPPQAAPLSQEACTSLLHSSIRVQTEEARTTVLQASIFRNHIGLFLLFLVSTHFNLCLISPSVLIVLFCEKHCICRITHQKYSEI